MAASTAGPQPKSQTRRIKRTKFIPLPAIRSLTLHPSFTNLTFKCHREASTTKNALTDVYAVNAVAFSPAHPDLFATAGSDGTYCVWDVNKKIRLRSFPKVNGPVTAVSFSRDGMALAYSVGYDWAKGYQHSNPAADRKIVVRCFGDALKK